MATPTITPLPARPTIGGIGARWWPAFANTLLRSHDDLGDVRCDDGTTGALIRNRATGAVLCCFGMSARVLSGEVSA